MTAKLLPVASCLQNYNTACFEHDMTSCSSFPDLRAETETDSGFCSDSSLGCSPPMRALTRPTEMTQESFSDTLEKLSSTTVKSLVFNPKPVTPVPVPKSEKVYDLTFCDLLTLFPANAQAVFSKLNCSSFYQFRQVNHELENQLSRRRKHFPVRQPVYQLDLTARGTVFLTSNKTRQHVSFKLTESNKYELLKVEPKYVNVFSYVFGSRTSRLMKKPSPSEPTNEWKDLCRFVMSQFGLHLDSDGNVLDRSKVPDYGVTLDFGAKTFPMKLAQDCLKKWNQQKTTFAELTVSFVEKLEDKQKMAEALLTGFKFEKVWSPSSHDDSLFCDVELWDYEDRLQRKFSLTLKDDPVLFYAALSENGEKMAVLVVADHAVKLSFCYVDRDGALLELRNRFMEVTKSDDFNCASEEQFQEMLQRLRN